MTTLREKRHRRCLDSIGRLTEQREHAFRRLAIIHNRLSDERRRLARLQKELGKGPTLTPERVRAALSEMPAVKREAPPPSPPELPDIPDFLRRSKAAEDRDAKVRAEIEAEVAARKAAKTKARIAKMKANLSDETRRMPLTGRAALKRIRGD